MSPQKEKRKRPKTLTQAQRIARLERQVKRLRLALFDLKVSRALFGGLH